MDKTPVDTRTLEEGLVERILNMTDPDYNGAGQPANARIVQAFVEEFRTKFEEECFQAWDIAQAFKIDLDYSRFLDEKRVFQQQREGFHAAVGAYNREREKEGKTDHTFPLPEEPAAPCADGCTDHDHHEAQPVSSQER
jgi:hypothetical protein